MTREAALAAARQHFDSGAFVHDLARRVAIRTESQNPASAPELRRYLADEITPSLAALGFRSSLHDNPVQPFGPLLIADRFEADGLPTVLMYGHGDALIATDGPRLSRERATVFLGSRGVANFELTLHLRDGSHHSGNWGGLLRNSGTVLANAIPPTAKATMHMRFVVGTPVDALQQALQSHLAAHGFGDIQVSAPEVMNATRLDPDNAWVRFALDSIERSTGQPPVLLPNLGGTLPNDVFADILGLPTVWVPHSYAGCSQHAPNEHLLGPVAREALQIMAGLFWDLGEQAGALPRISH